MEPTIISETFGNMLVPFGGSALAGFFVGFALRKILKLVITIAGVVLGLFFMGLYFMQSRGYIQAPGVDWNRVGNDIANSTQQYLGNTQNLTITHNIVHQLGIPVTSGLAIGLLAGFARTR